MKQISSKFFSIIIPVYNVKQYIKFTLDSIKNQTFKNFEVICINDGSTDGSEIILEDFATKDDRFKIFHKKNEGVSSARNLGIEKACGLWIIFIDGDDAIREDGLEIIHNAIQLYPTTDIVAYGAKFVESITKNDLHKKNETFPIHNEDCIPIIPFKALNHYTVWTAAFRQTLLENIRFEDLKNGEDQLFYNQAILKAEKYIEIQTEIYYYLQRPGSAVNSTWNLKRQTDLLTMYRRITENLIYSERSIDRRWLKRWIKNLLSVPSNIWYLPNYLTSYLIEQKKTLKLVLQLKEIPWEIRIWVWIATQINNSVLFRIIIGYPIKLYNRFKN